MTLMLFCASLPAAAQVPGDPCATAQQYKVNGGPETSGVVHMMVCEGGTWKSIVSSNAAGEVTKIGNQTCASNDYFKFDGTKFICTTAGGAALSGITAATGGNSINSGDHAQTWNWQLTTADKDAFTFTENTASTATGHSSVLKAATLATSTATPFMITNLGAANSFRVNDETGDADTSPFVIQADGDVGIGTTTPSSKLHIGRGSTTTADIGAIFLQSGNGAGLARDWKLYSDGTGNFAIRDMGYNNSGGGMSYDAFVIKYDGTVGIGTATPSTLLDMVGLGTVSNTAPHVKLSDAANGLYGSVADSDNATGGTIDFRFGATESFGVFSRGFVIRDETSGANRFFINPSGNIGIGTATPAHKLTVSGDFADDGILIENIRNTDSDSGNLNFRRARGTSATPLVPTSGDELAHIEFQGYDGAGGHTTAADIIATLDGTSSGGGDMPGQLTFRTRADGAGITSTRMVIDNSGSVGIGVSTPPSKFVVAPPASAAVADGGTITADACGTIKQITSTGNVTTNTTDTFTAPTASYAGCCMTVINVDTADTITLDANTLFKTIGGANQALGPSDAVEVCSNGTNWYQIGAVSANQ